MDEIKNNIITISGEPASGKSTVIRTLQEKYTKMGYTVHIEPIGHYWREAAVETYKKLKPEMQNVTLDEIHADPDFETFRKKIDLALDEKVRRRGEEINSENRPNEVFIFDSRLAWKNIPSSYAIRLTVDEKIAGKRVYEDPTRGIEDKYPSREAAIKATALRKQEEIKRYKKRYQVDLSDPQNYDLIVDTSYSNIQELADIIIEGEERYRKGELYPKMWASPAHFITIQKIRECSEAKTRNLAQRIKEKGYDPLDGVLSVVENNGAKFLLDGNHRSYGGLSAGKTLFPYLVTHRDDEVSALRAQEIYDDFCLECIYDWGEAIQYYGGEIGGIEQLKGFKVTDLLHIDKIPIARKLIGVTKEQDEER